MNERERIGQRIKELRTEKNISQDKLAELAGIESVKGVSHELSKENILLELIRSKK